MSSVRRRDGPGLSTRRMRALPAPARIASAAACSSGRASKLDRSLVQGAPKHRALMRAPTGSASWRTCLEGFRIRCRPRRFAQRWRRRARRRWSISAPAAVARGSRSSASSRRAARCASSSPTSIRTSTRSRRSARGAKSALEFRGTSVDATDVPHELDGVRTMFNCFHHFPPEHARAILADAVRKRRGIAIFEGIDHRGLGLAGMIFQLPAILLLTPFVRPFRLSRLFFTYVLRSFRCSCSSTGRCRCSASISRTSSHELVASIDGHEAFDWEIGSTPLATGSPVGITYLVGTPKLG